MDDSSELADALQALSAARRQPQKPVHHGLVSMARILRAEEYDSTPARDSRLDLRTIQYPRPKGAHK